MVKFDSSNPFYGFKRVSFFICIILLLFLPSCSSQEAQVVSDPVVSPTAVRGVLATVAPKVGTPLPVMITVTKETVPPTAVLTITKPAPTFLPTAVKEDDIPTSGFSGLRFALTADDGAQSEFPAGTEVVFALWEYAGMTPTDKIRRIWFRDDQIWITREEGWDWEEYGSDGTVRDISIFDNEGSGLPIGSYRLQLYVNDVLQEEATFVIIEAGNN